MNEIEENTRASFKSVISDGVRIFLRNPLIAIFIFGGMILIYLFILGAITLIVSPEKLEEITAEEPEKFVEELRILLTENIEKTIIAMLVFGVIAFVIAEFVAAGVVGVALNASRGGDASLSAFLRYGYIYTPKMVILEILMSIALIAVIFPIAMIFYVSRNPAVEFLQSIVVFVMSILLFPARFILVYEDAGVFESLANGLRFGFDNFPWIAIILILSSILIVPVFIFPPAVVVAVPALISLSTIWFSRFYVIARGSSDIKRVNANGMLD